MLLLFFSLFCLHFHFVHYIACWRSDEWLLDKTGLLFLSCGSQGITGKCRWMNSCEYTDTDGFSSPSPGSFSGFLFIQIRQYVKKTHQHANMPRVSGKIQQPWLQNKARRQRRVQVAPLFKLLCYEMSEQEMFGSLCGSLNGIQVGGTKTFHRSACSSFSPSNNDNLLCLHTLAASLSSNSIMQANVRMQHRYISFFYCLNSVHGAVMI